MTLVHRRPQEIAIVFELYETRILRKVHHCAIPIITHCHSIGKNSSSLWFEPGTKHSPEANARTRTVPVTYPFIQCQCHTRLTMLTNTLLCCKIISPQDQNSKRPHDAITKAHTHTFFWFLRHSIKLVSFLHYY